LHQCVLEHQDLAFTLQLNMLNKDLQLDPKAYQTPPSSITNYNRML
jgi:hypothetical protein